MIMKYKVGDKVKIKSLDWYNANKDKNGSVNTDAIFIPEMSLHCGKIVEIIEVEILKDGSIDYYLDIDNGEYNWTDDMFDENFKDMETKKIIIPEGWEIDKVEGNEVILKESKKELPKTWESCIWILLDNGKLAQETVKEVTFRHSVPKGLSAPMTALSQLLACREVYRGGWKPDWNEDKTKYIIYMEDGNIIKSGAYRESRILSFQSAEVRDQFLENFRDLIKEAKELI